MSKGRTLLIASVVGAAMAVVGVVAASAAGRSAAPNTFLAAASPTPAAKSNETSAHESTETAARETAEYNGTFHGGPAGSRGATCSTAILATITTALVESASIHSTHQPPSSIPP